jgi:hypothetical protein
MSAPAGSDRIVAGRYHLIEPLGSGGMGTVWLAQDRLLRRAVAAKEILPPAAMTTGERTALRQRTLREARTAARLSHPNVVAIYDVAEDHGRPWIIMELIQARSLRDVLEQDGPLDPPAAARVGLQVLAALRSAHALGIMHRDVKPGNVLIEADGRAVLADFGIARAQDSTAITTSGVLVGSPSYIAPERAQGDPGGPASDLWSLGATLYAAVEGRPPYERGGALATLMAVVSDPPDPPRRAGPLWPLISGLLAADQARRPSADEAERLLRHAAESGGGPVTGSGGVPVAEAGGGPEAGPGGAPATAPMTAAPMTAAPMTAAPPATVEMTAAGGQPPADFPGRAERTRAFGTAGGPAPDPPPARPSAPTPPSGPPLASEPAPQPEAARAEASEPAPGPGPAAELAAGAAPGPEAAGEPAPEPVLEPQPELEPQPVLTPQPAPEREPAPAGRLEPAPGAPGRRAAVRPRSQLIAAIAAVVAIAGTALGLYLASRPAAAPSASGRAGRPATAPPSPAAGTSTAPRSPSRTPAATAPARPAFGTAAPVPAGYHTYQDPTGFSIAMPDGWSVSHQGGYVYLTQPSGGAFLLIDQSDHPLPDPLANWQQQEANRRSTYPDYHRVRLAAIDYPQAQKAADWEFTYDRGGVPTHVLNRNVLANSRHAYALYWSAPQAEWAGEFAVFTVLARTFQPAA